MANNNIQQYIDLVTSEHADKPNFIAWLTANVALIDDLSSMLDVFSVAFDIDTATGSQLDILGEVIGVARTVPWQPTGIVSPIMDDDHFRLALKARIAINQWDGTITQLFDIWYNLLPNVYLILHDNQDMSMSALVIGMADTMDQDLVAHGYIVPKPEGVHLNVAFLSTKVFALGLENDVFGGLGEGYWISGF
jgi:hypothetical protein